MILGYIFVLDIHVPRIFLSSTLSLLGWRLYKSMHFFIYTLYRPRKKHSNRAMNPIFTNVPPVDPVFDINSQRVGFSSFSTHSDSVALVEGAFSPLPQKHVGKKIYHDLNPPSTTLGVEQHSIKSK